MLFRIDRSYLDMRRQQSVKQVDIRIAEDREVLVLLNRRLLVVEHVHASLRLLLERLDTRRCEAVGPEVLASFGRVRRVEVGPSMSTPISFTIPSDRCDLAESLTEQDGYA